MRSVRISLKTARALLEMLGEHPWSDNQQAVLRAGEELRAAMAPKRSKAVSGPTRRQARETKRLTKKEETAAIRAEVLRRAEGICELCESAGADDLHHAFGRVRQRQSVSNTLAVCRPCHRALTNNVGGAAHWLDLQAMRFRNLGYAETARLLDARCQFVLSRGAA